MSAAPYPIASASSMPVSKSRISFLRIFALFPLPYSGESQPALDESVEDGVGGFAESEADDVDAA